jgi:hypothetical protein
MHRRSLIGMTCLAPLLTGCIYSRTFELEWEEEALQPDGRIVVVHLKRKYERLTQGFTPYGGQNLFWESTLMIDAGPPLGRVRQLFRGFWPMFVGDHANVWYAVIAGGYPNLPAGSEVQNWGDYETDSSQLAIKLVDGAWKPVSLLELPEVFQRPNLLIPAEDLSKLAQFDGKRVRLSDKSFVGAQPRSPGSALLLRPRPGSQRLQRRP